MIFTALYDAFGAMESSEDQYFEQYPCLYLVGRLGLSSDNSSAVAFRASNTCVAGLLLPVDGGSFCKSTAGIRNDFLRRILVTLFAITKFSSSLFSTVPNFRECYVSLS